MEDNMYFKIHPIRVIFENPNFIESIKEISVKSIGRGRLKQIFYFCPRYTQLERIDIELKESKYYEIDMAYYESNKLQSKLRHTREVIINIKTIE